MNTHARLLYKTGKKVEAIEWEKKAISRLESMKMDSNRFKPVLNSMLADESKVDEY